MVTDDLRDYPTWRKHAGRVFKPPRAPAPGPGDARRSLARTPGRGSPRRAGAAGRLSAADAGELVEREAVLVEAVHRRPLILASGMAEA